VHTEDHPLDYATFHGEIPRGEYGGGQVTIWDHGTYEVLKWDEREVKVILHGSRLTGGYVLFATGGKNWMIHRERMALPATLTPMLASPGSAPARGLDAWGVEFKWDGVRALAFIEAGRLRLVSRTGKDISATYPEVAGLGRAVAH
jgi:bifunctional non-homologous end joining protein LigD